MNPMIVTGREIDGGEAATDKAMGLLIGQQLRHSVVLAFGLQDSVFVDAAQLTDGAVSGTHHRADRGINGAGAGCQCAGKKGVEVVELRWILNNGLAQIDPVTADKPTDQPRARPCAFCQSAGQAGQPMMRYQILQEYKVATNRFPNAQRGLFYSVSRPD